MATESEMIDQLELEAEKDEGKDILAEKEALLKAERDQIEAEKASLSENKKKLEMGELLTKASSDPDAAYQLLKKMGKTDEEIEAMVKAVGGSPKPQGQPAPAPVDPDLKEMLEFFKANKGTLVGDAKKSVQSRVKNDCRSLLDNDPFFGDYTKGNDERGEAFADQLQNMIGRVMGDTGKSSPDGFVVAEAMKRLKAQVKAIGLERPVNDPTRGLVDIQSIGMTSHDFNEAKKDERVPNWHPQYEAWVTRKLARSIAAGRGKGDE